MKAKEKLKNPCKNFCKNLGKKISRNSQRNLEKFEEFLKKNSLKELLRKTHAEISEVIPNTLKKKSLEICLKNPRMDFRRIPTRNFRNNP